MENGNTQKIQIRFISFNFLFKIWAFCGCYFDKGYLCGNLIRKLFKKIGVCNWDFVHYVF